MHEQDIDIAHIEDSGQTGVKTLLGTHVHCELLFLLRLISASHQVSLGTQTPHILSLAVIRVGVDVPRQTKLSYFVLTLQKHALHQSCSSEYYDNNLIFTFSLHPILFSCKLCGSVGRHNAITIRVNCIAQ